MAALVLIINNIFSRSTFALFTIALLSIQPFDRLQAQENATSPPDPLQWPFITGPDSSRSILLGLLRSRIEDGANAELCKVFMRDQNITIPADFDFSMCPADIANKVLNRHGKIKWASGAKPTECGMSCWGRPFMTREQFYDRPNVNYAMFFGHLDFEVDNPGPNRSVRFGYEAQFRCVIPPGARDGSIEVRLVFGQPVIGDPSFWESLANFLVPINLSRQIEDGIRRELTKPGTTVIPDNGRCTSIGVEALPQGDPNFDSIRFDLPPSGVSTAGHISSPAVTALKKSATVHFLRITRRPPVFGYDSPNDSGTFHVFVNGIPGFFPDTPTLPPAGGGIPLNLCKSIDLTDSDRLQIIFDNSLGGAVWSQFSPALKYGAGPTHLMTTGRTVVVPGLPGPPGSPPPKPRTLVLREFEITYTIEYHAPPTIVGVSPTGGGSTPPSAGGLATHGITSGVLSGETRGGPPQPCQSI